MDEIATLCNDVSLAVADSIKDLIGTQKGSEVVGIGADGTPSKFIDITAENAALEILASSGIDMKIVTEEKGHLTFGDAPEFTVVLDPLDGTYNATRDVPFYSVSIAIGDADLTDIRYAEVYNLANGMDFTATKNKGAFYNNKKIQVSSTAKLGEFTVASYGYKDRSDVFNRLGRHVRRLRSFGSAALELSFVASGRLDAFIDLRGRLRIMDVAAGILIVREAGGIVTDGHGRTASGELNVTNRVDIVASNGILHHVLEKTAGAL